MIDYLREARPLTNKLWLGFADNLGLTADDSISANQKVNGKQSYYCSLTGIYHP